MYQKVDYSAMGKSEEFTNYERLSRELIRTDVTALNRQEKLAFFINVYNALVIHANIRRGSPTNLWQRYKVSLSLLRIETLYMSDDR